MTSPMYRSAFLRTTLGADEASEMCDVDTFTAGKRSPAGNLSLATSTPFLLLLAAGALPT